MTSDFDYELPPGRVARYPAAHRADSRLLVLSRSTGRIEHRRFRDLPGLMGAGDLLVVNDTRVFPARLLGRKPTGAAGEVLLLRPAESNDDRVWEALVRPGRKLKPGRLLRVAPELAVRVLSACPDGRRIVRLESGMDASEALRRFGHTPLPPYIERDDEPLDRERYQTVYARHEGSVAAPTAGLHFTQALLDEVAGLGVARTALTLHVGTATFRPVEVDDPAHHGMDAEHYVVPDAAAREYRRCRERGGRVWAVGTTVVRTLESVAEGGGRIRAGAGTTDLFIRPPFEFRAVDCLVTNFHLPRSTLLMLVAAFADIDTVRAAYAEAIATGYRFYSYGDAMALLP
ncbi:MAG: tRNA preQ1(34) S-adenosylmethionine ribosyltransferase-isomerase QueA [Gemmatimonadetes bacterium]|nr:tRNA preQ1(34) S-adenosylmethionine ribosyltransferase-isomerase QueA [Gemmatimonadota bacterium]MYG36272.1 tRNA preQ1(34) S-adenosylmethionine ribosyltransferase-isomerase QueA [Gemmatimonadota bacterium]